MDKTEDGNRPTGAFCEDEEEYREIYLGDPAANEDASEAPSSFSVFSQPVTDAISDESETVSATSEMDGGDFRTPVPNQLTTLTLPTASPNEITVITPRDGRQLNVVPVATRIRVLEESPPDEHEWTDVPYIKLKSGLSTARSSVDTTRTPSMDEPKRRSTTLSVDTEFVEPMEPPNPRAFVRHFSIATPGTTPTTTPRQCERKETPRCSGTGDQVGASQTPRGRTTSGSMVAVFEDEDLEIRSNSDASRTVSVSIITSKRNATFWRSRCCCFGCLGMCVVFLMLASLGFFLGVPAFVRSIAADVGITMTRCEVSHVSESGFSSHVVLNIEVPKPPMTPTCHTFQTSLTLAHDFSSESSMFASKKSTAVQGSRVLGSVTVPAMQLGKETVVQLASNFTIADTKAVIEFLARLGGSQSPLDVVVSGDMKVGFSMFWWSLTVPIKVPLKFWGLAPLKAVSLQSLELPFSDSLGLTVTSKLVVPNPTGWAFQGLGPLNAKLSIDGDDDLGTAKLLDFHVNEGETTLLLSGEITSTDSDSRSALLSAWLAGSRPEVNFSVNNISGAPSWMSRAFGALKGSVQLPRPAITSMLRDLQVRSLHLTIAEDGSATLQGALVTTIDLPFGFKYQLEEVAGTVQLIGDKGNSVAEFDIPPAPPRWLPSMSNSTEPGDGGWLIFINNSTVRPLDKEGFGEELAKLFQNTATLHVSGTVSLTIVSQIGTDILDVQFTHLDATISPALGPIPLVQISSTEILEAHQGHLLLTPSLEVPNPSSTVGCDIAPCINGTVTYAGRKVGALSMCRTSLLPNTTSHISASMELFSANPSGLQLSTDTAASDIVKQYIKGEDITLHFRGDSMISNYEPAALMLRPVAAALSSDVVLKGLPRSMIESLSIDIMDPMSHPSEVPVRIAFVNPWSVDFNIQSMMANLSLNGVDIGMIVSGVTPNTRVFHIKGGHSHQILNRIALHCPQACRKKLLPFLWEQKVIAKLFFAMHFSMDNGFEIDVEYEQEGIPAHVNFVQENTSSFQVEHVLDSQDFSSFRVRDYAPLSAADSNQIVI